jgi:hypothetical protein
MFNALETPPEERLKRFIRGLPEAMATAVAAQRPQTWEEAYAIANNIQQLVRKLPGKEAPAEPEPEAKTLPPILQPIAGNAPIAAGSPADVDILSKQLEKLSLILAPQAKQKDQAMDNLAFQVEKIAQVLASKSTGSGSGNGNRMNMNGRCAKCLKMGHLQRECNNTAAPEAVQCTYCNMYGHIEATCRAKARRLNKQSNTLMSLLHQLSPEQLDNIIQLNSMQAPTGVIDDGQLENEEDESLPSSHMFGLIFSGQGAPLPPCEILPPEPEDVTDYESPSESSFVLTSESEGEEDHVVPHLLNVDNVLRRGRERVRDRPPSMRDPIEQNPRNRQRRERREDARPDPRPPQNAPPPPERMEVNGQPRMTKEERKAQRRQQSYRIFNAIMEKKQLSLLAQTSGLLPYGRKQLHTYVDEEILHYQARQRRQPVAAENLVSHPTLNQEETPSGGPSSRNLEFLPNAEPEARTGRLCRIYVTMAGMQIPAIVDSGSEFSVVSYELLRAMGLADYMDTKNPPQFTASDHGVHNAKGKITLILQVGKMRCRLPLIVTGGRNASTY